MDDLAAIADELCDPIRTVERIVERDESKHLVGRKGRAPRRIWTAVFPSLLDQLAQAVVPGETYAEPETVVGSHQPPGPRDGARIEAVARYLAIQAGAAVWCRTAGVPLREKTAHNIRALVGAAPTLDADDRASLHSDMNRWRTWAAVASGWQRPDDAPRGTCPACGALNTIHVRLSRQMAYCAGCGATWDVDTIGLLAAHMAKPHVDTSALRTAAVAARRAEEQARIELAGVWRPDLPYVGA